MVRSPLNSVSVELKRGAWNVEEDRKLVDYIKRYGIWNWNQMPQAAGLMRSGKSCRLRWLNYLRPNIRHGNFNRQEEDIIIKWHKLLGNKWSTIATKLPGRTDNEIKNIWNTYLKKRTMSDQSMQQPKMSAAPPAVIRDKTTQPCKSLSGESVFDRSSSSSTSPVSSIDNRTETESEGEGNNGLQADTTVVSPGYCVWVSELHDNVIFDDICGGFLPNYYQQEALTNEWVIGDLWTR